MTSCQEFQGMIELYFEDRLSDQDRKRVEAHFCECDKCMQKVESIDSLEEHIAEMPNIQMPKYVKHEIFKKINRQENESFLNRFSFDTGGKLKLAGAGIALAMLVLVLFRIPNAEQQKPQTEQYSREQVLRAEDQLKWSLVYVSQVVKKTKKSTVEDVLLNQLPSTVRDCVEETVPFLKGGSK